MISKSAKTYIALVIASGTLLLLLAAKSWAPTNLPQFFIYLALAVLASTFKVRIPGVESTMSPNFVFLLLGIAALPFSQLVAIALVAALVQSMWASAKRVRLVQVAFSAAALVLSASIAYGVSHLVVGADGTSPVGLVLLAGSIYFPVNSLLVSLVIGLTQGQSLGQVCRHCYQWVFPYFVGGIAFISLVSGAYVRPALWKGALTVLPAVVLLYVYFLTRSSRAAATTSVVASSHD